MNIFNFKSY